MSVQVQTGNRGAKRPGIRALGLTALLLLSLRALPAGDSGVAERSAIRKARLIGQGQGSNDLTVMIEYVLAHDQYVSLKMFNILGTEVLTLEQSARTAGVHTVRFDASEVPSGVYIFRLQSGDSVYDRRFVLIQPGMEGVCNHLSEEPVASAGS
ncbi:MAG TPA: T9SS type A sorting domain-containing protein [Bacteroidota bacterium]|jgi:hypothetical protein